MTIRPTMASTYELVRSGLNHNFVALIRAQEQVSSGKRILRPSDDPVGTSTSLALRRQLGDVGRYLSSAAASKPVLQTATSALEEASTLLSQARELVMQGLSGTLNSADRANLGNQLELLKERLIELGNSRSGDRYLFGGTATGSPPFTETGSGTSSRVVYAGNDQAQTLTLGLGVEVAINMPGSELFGSFAPSGTTYAGTTGAAGGTTADQGVGYERLLVRHTSTTGTPGSGAQLANGGANDTFVGERALVFDASANTVRFGNGPALTIPASGSADAANFVARDEFGAEVRLDLSAYDGTSSTATLTGEGTISLGGIDHTTLDFTNADLELRNSETGAIVHVDTRAITRAGSDLITFSGTANVFDVLQGMADDLRNADNLDTAGLQQRLGARLTEFDRNHDGLLVGLGTLGARSERLVDAESRLGELDLHLTSLLSNVEEADITATILDMTKAEQTLQLAQATGSRLLQNTLLDYLR